MEAIDKNEHQTWLAKIERAAHSFRSASEEAVERAEAEADAARGMRIPAASHGH